MLFLSCVTGVTLLCFCHFHFCFNDECDRRRTFLLPLPISLAARFAHKFVFFLFLRHFFHAHKRGTFMKAVFSCLILLSFLLLYYATSSYQQQQQQQFILVVTCIIINSSVELEAKVILESLRINSMD